MFTIIVPQGEFFKVNANRRHYKPLHKFLNSYQFFIRNMRFGK